MPQTLMGAVFEEGNVFLHFMKPITTEFLPKLFCFLNHRCNFNIPTLATLKMKKILN